MASFVNMSLEDIIQKKKGRTRNNVSTTKSFKKSNQNNVVTDARNKIIAKKRTHISDAREKLAELAKQKDARYKLDQLRQKKLGVAKAFGRNRIPMGNTHDIRAKRTRPNPNFEMVFQDHTRQVTSQTRQNITRASMKHQITAKKFMETRSFGTKDSGSFSRVKPIVRTVENDIVRLDDDDPMGEEFAVPMKASLNRHASLNLKIIAHNSDARSKTSSRRSAPSEREKSPPRLTSILKKRPMAALRTEKKTEKKEEVAATEYRIIVSNLRNTVTSGDIQELFGDVGGMIESRLARPGIAEVIYTTQEDAQRAVDLYHNRQLDGQPMTCLLVTPRAAAAAPPARNNAKPTLPPSSNSNVEPDLSTFHKVLFSNF